MFRISAALAAALFISCAAERPARAKDADPTSPAAPVPAAAAAVDPLADVKLVPDDDEDEKKKEDDPHSHHHHHGGGK